MSESAPPTVVEALRRFDSDTRRIAADWLKDAAVEARQDDPSVGIFANEDLAACFRALAHVALAAQGKSDNECVLGKERPGQKNNDRADSREATNSRDGSGLVKAADGQDDVGVLQDHAVGSPSQALPSYAADRADGFALAELVTEAKRHGLIDEQWEIIGFWNPMSQVMFRAGLIACREYMARFVEAESPTIAASIRANWWPSLGDDPGGPRRYRWDEMYEGEYPDGQFKTPPASVEALPFALRFLQQHCLGYEDE